MLVQKKVDGIERIKLLADRANRLATTLRDGDRVRFRSARTGLRGFGTLKGVWLAAMDTIAFKIRVDGLNDTIDVFPELGDALKKMGPRDDA